MGATAPVPRRNIGWVVSCRTGGLVPSGTIAAELPRRAAV